MKAFDIRIALTVFLGSLLLDILWTFGIRRMAQGKAFQSALLSASITLVGGFVITEYVGNLLYLIPSALGALIGNYFSIKFDTRDGIKPHHRRLRKHRIH